MILGGLHVTARPDEAAGHSDAIVLGEGEPVWPTVVADLMRGELQPAHDARPHPFDLSLAPMPRSELLDPTRYNRLTVQTQRGCPCDCEFCAASIRLSRRYRAKPIDKVIAEIRCIQEIWPRLFVEFAYDNTFANRQHGKHLMRALAGERVRWFTETDKHDRHSIHVDALGLGRPGVPGNVPRCLEEAPNTDRRRLTAPRAYDWTRAASPWIMAGFAATRAVPRSRWGLGKPT